ncbi:MAG: hypothetical protein Q4Q07_09155 [Tissierellia bacterium]|nr:hypothetical protein [Tissierellia bacterium]
MKKFMVILLILGLLIGCSGNNSENQSGGAKNQKEEVAQEEEIQNLGLPFDELPLADDTVNEKIMDAFENQDISWEGGDWKITLEKGFWRNQFLLVQFATQYQGEDETKAALVPYVNFSLWDKEDYIITEKYMKAKDHGDGIFAFDAKVKMKEMDWKSLDKLSLTIDKISFKGKEDPEAAEENIFEFYDDKRELPFKNQVDTFPEKHLAVEDFHFEEQGYILDVKEIILDDIYPRAIVEISQGEGEGPGFPRLFLYHGDEELILESESGFVPDHRIYYAYGFEGIYDWDKIKGEFCFMEENEEGSLVPAGKTGGVEIKTKEVK